MVARCCQNCRHFYPTQFKHGCNHPDARQFSRVYGWHPALIEPDPLRGVKRNLAVLEDCDREDRFAAKHPWWALWRAA